VAENIIRVLFIADIVGNPGLNALEEALPVLRETHKPDLIVANGENSAHGKGLTPHIAEGLFQSGIQVITTGNHIWSRKNIFESLEHDPRILRPLNYPADTPGHGSTVLTVKGKRIGVVNLQGRAFMYSIDCPFRCMDEEIKRLRGQQASIVIVDFHAEATAEKIALAWYLDGRVSSVIGTHTHVQTADERILPGGTSTITDAGMTGPVDSVIGMDKDTAVKRFRTQLPVMYRIASGDSIVCGVGLTIDSETGQSLSIVRFQYHSNTSKP